MNSTVNSIAIVYHSGYGHTRKQAEAVAAGASAVAGARPYLVAIDAEGNLPGEAWEKLNAADAIVFGSPTYMGNVSWQFKKFADASSKAWAARAWQNKIAAGFTNSASINGDKHAVLQALQTLAMQHGMVWVGNPILPEQHTGVPYDEAANRLGSWSGLMAQAGHGAAADAFVPGDTKTARMFGQHFAETLLRLGGMAAHQPAEAVAA